MLICEAMSTRYVIGIDAGGTKTVGLLADEQGNISTKARGGGANLVVHGELAAEKVLYQIIEGVPSLLDILIVGSILEPVLSFS